MSANILEIHHLTKRFSDFTLNDLSLTVAPGTITGLVGANGAGKSTTIKLILNLLHRDSGEIRVSAWITYGMRRRSSSRSAWCSTSPASMRF